MDVVLAVLNLLYVFRSDSPIEQLHIYSCTRTSVRISENKSLVCKHVCTYMFNLRTYTLYVSVESSLMYMCIVHVGIYMYMYIVHVHE